MKKSIFVVTILFAIFLFGSVTYSLRTSQSIKTETNSLLLKNIEALAAGEDGTDEGEEDAGEVLCLSKGSLDCPNNHVKVKYIMDGYSLR